MVRRKCQRESLDDCHEDRDETFTGQRELTIAIRSVDGWLEMPGAGERSRVYSEVMFRLL